MKLERLYQTVRLWAIPGDAKRAEWCKKKNIYAGMGDNVRIMDRKVPLYSKLIKFHNNIQIASNVSFVTHDAIHGVFNSMKSNNSDTTSSKCIEYSERIGCIEIMDNVFIGTGVIILGNVRIGPNAVVAAGAVVNYDVPENSVVGGIPAKVIGRFDKLVKKREQDIYPDKLKPIDQIVDDELVRFMWNEFEKRRK